MKDSKKMIVGAVLYTLLYWNHICFPLSGIYSPIFLGICFVGFFCVCRDSVSVFDDKMAEVRCWNTFCISCGRCLCAHGRRDDSKLGIDFVDRNIDGHYSLCNR